jgi:Zn-finger nucleic acid-binding protein
LGDRQIVECGDETIEVCSDCGGAWVQKDFGESLRRRSHPARTRLLVEVKRIRTGRHLKPQRQLLCPTCGVELATSSTGVPACPKCASAFVDFYALPDYLALSQSATA